MVKNFRFIFLFMLFMLTQMVWGQVYSTRSKKAIQYYQSAEDYIIRRQLPEAIHLLNQALGKDETFIEAHLKIAYVYKLMNNIPLQKIHLEAVITNARDPSRYKNIYLALGEANYLLMNYDQAMSFLEQFLNFPTADPRLISEANWLISNVNFARENIKNPVEFEPVRMSDRINEGPLQYFPVLTADEKKIFFTRRPGHHPQYDEDIYVSEKDSSGQWSFPFPISRMINTNYNEGTCTISADGKILIFTSCLGRRNFGSCDLFITYREGIDWTPPKNMGPEINSSSWDSQPALSADGRRLYFVSERPGGQGKRDIWMSEINEKGEWELAENLGPVINTPEDDVSPFIHVNGQTLYFASKGRLGFGGYDLYSSEFIDGSWTEPANLGYPLNTPEDQVSLFVTTDGETAYYSLDSWTSQGTPTSMIYLFEMPEKIRVTNRSSYITGKIRDAETLETLKAGVELMDVNENRLISRVNSDSLSGEYTMVLTEGSDYALYVEKPGYVFESRHFSTPAETGFEPVEMDFYLKKIKAGASTILNNLFFDVNKYELKERSITELQRIISYMNNNPDLKIEIRGHTDDTGSAAYNMELSLKRAEAVYQYLVNHGIAQSRLQYQGFGQTEPAVPNDSEENRSRNRRIEFRIAEMD
ncbi:MAG: OmpA family protein [Cyclobacteriaceae bacterium]|nr:OmpA family protein [Cyclobacteriaceae bacterium]